MVLIAAALTLALLSSAAVALPERADAGPGSAVNSATRWMQRALDAVRSGSPAAHTSTPGAARTYAITTAAMYDAVNGIDVASGTSSRGRALVASYDGAPPGGDRNAAAGAAAHAVLASLFAANPTVKSSLDQALADELAALGSDPAVESGRAWGASVGNEVVSRRSSDGTQTTTSQLGGSGPGVFPRTFSGTQFRNMVPFGVATVQPYLSSGPPALTSTAYADAFNEVKEIGSLGDTDPERSAIARHWLAEAGTVRETGLWFKVALVVAEEQGTAASLSDTVRLLALLGMGVADAVVTSWNDKFNWHYWRPGDAIRQASTDGNPATEEDPGWSPRSGACAIGADLATCNTFGGTPEHTSGTSTFAGAASTILASFYCRDRIAFSFAGEQPGSPARSYRKFSQAAREAGRSRIYGGIHFQFSNAAGRRAGKKIAKEIVRTRLLAAGSRPKAGCKVD
jgi:PAP2 superfamily